MELDNKILSIFTLILNKNSHGNQDILNLYKTLDDVDLFLKVVSRFEGRTIKFPTVKEIEDSLTTALVYYYREQGMSWSEIKTILPVDFSPEGYSMKIKSLNAWILKSMKDIVEHDKR